MGETQSGHEGLFLAPPTPEVAEPESKIRNVGASAMRRLRHPFTGNAAGKAEPPADPPAQPPAQPPADPPAEPSA
jgi:hypothetical protein